VTLIETINVNSFAEPAIATCARGQTQGIWGTSLYYAMMPYNVEITKRISGISNVRELYEFPERVVIIMEDQTIEAKEYGDDDEVVAQKMSAHTEQLFDKQHGITTYTDGSDLKFVTPDANNEDMSHTQIDRITNMLYLVAGLSQSFVGQMNVETNSKVTGETMRQTHQVTKLTARDIINSFIPCINHVLSTITGTTIEASWEDALEAQQVETEAERRDQRVVGENNERNTLRDNDTE